MSTWAQRERAELVALLRALGPSADVLCDGWTTGDLAAHLYVRERRPDAVLGVVVPGPVAAYTSRVMAGVLRGGGYDHVLDVLAGGPPWPLRPLDSSVNLMEFFVHHEDVRRAQGESPRPLPPGMEAALFARLRMLLRVALLRLRDVRVELVAAHGETASFGNGPVVRLRGPAGELALWVFERRGVAEVDVTGEPGAVDRVSRARLSV